MKRTTPELAPPTLKFHFHQWVDVRHNTYDLACNSSSNGKKKIVVVKPQTDQDGITRSSSHVIILPELNTEKNVGKIEPSTDDNEMESPKILKFPNFISPWKNKTKGLGEDMLNVSTYKAKMKKPFTFPVKNYFPNFKIIPDKNKVVSTEKSKLSTAKSKEETKLLDYPIKNYSPNLEKISAKNKPKGLGKGENEAKTSSVGDENNPEDIRVLVESFRKKLPLFVEKEQENLPNLTSKTHWLYLESNVLQKWIDSCLENSEIGSTEEEEEEDIEPEMYISYNKKDFNKIFFCHPSLFPFAAVARIFKLILQTTLIFGVIILAFIVIAFAKVKETHGCFYIRDQIAKTNTFQNLRNAFGAIHKYHAPEAVLHLQSPTSSCSSRISLQTIIEDSASIHQGQSLYDWEWIEKVYLSREGSCKFHNDYSEV
ncbi:hypothetical protein AVEN_148645-1 [Araneus ventricosus]|uniref:Uncharacterized protein n=1 Tax=Araneus ventricosus TaxID=182803 RepID=A0A4Y2TB21_ARAVE|nr:hypothetical protein AVEN_148645-1 [Araneus ventricosus]